MINDDVCHGGGLCIPTKIGRNDATLLKHGSNGLADSLSLVVLTEMIEHECARQDERGWIDNSLPRQIRAAP